RTTLTLTAGGKWTPRRCATRVRRLRSGATTRDRSSLTRARWSTSASTRSSRRDGSAAPPHDAGGADADPRGEQDEAGQRHAGDQGEQPEHGGDRGEDQPGG